MPYGREPSGPGFAYPAEDRFALDPLQIGTPLSSKKPGTRGTRVTAAEAYSAAAFADCYSRMNVLVELAPKMERSDWLTLLGEWWSGCENVEFHQGMLKALLGTRGPISEMMSAEERERWDALSDELRCYRVCGKKYVSGPSWSLDAGVARQFPKVNPFVAEEPLLLTGSVRKETVLAVKLDRGAPELISFSVRPLSVHELRP
jgi:hypothetical protein